MAFSKITNGEHALLLQQLTGLKDAGELEQEAKSLYERYHALRHEQEQLLLNYERLQRKVRKRSRHD